MLEWARVELTKDVVHGNCRSNFRSTKRKEVAQRERQSPWSEASNQRFASLVNAVDSDIIPRLMLAHRPSKVVTVAEQVRLQRPSRHQVVALTQLLLKDDTGEAVGFVEAMLSSGIMPEALYLEVFAPTARYLGELWEADISDFVEVTIALGRLNEMLRLLSTTFQSRDQADLQNRSVLLASMPEDQHSLGLTMVAEFFRRAGWGVRDEERASARTLSSIVSSDWFDAAGFSVSCECELDGLARCICSLREASLNTDISVLVGGPVFVQHPELVAQVGADASAGDARQAVFEAEKLVALRC